MSHLTNRNIKSMPHHRIWLMIAILTPLVLSISLSMDIYVPSLPMIIQRFHTTQQALQWTLSIYMFGVGIGQLCFGPLSDFFGRRKIVLTGVLIYFIGTVVCIYSYNIHTLILGRLLQSIGTCASLVVAYAVVRDLYDVKTSAKIYSFLNAATALGPVVAPLLGGYLQDYFHTWRASFVFLLLFAIISLVTITLFLKETLPTHARSSIKFSALKSRYKTILKNKTFLASSYHASVGMTVMFVFCCISPYIIITNLHGSETMYGVAFSSNAIAFIIANIISSQISHHFEIKLSIILGIAVLVFGSFFMLALNMIEGLSMLHFMLPMWFITAGAGITMGPAVAIALEKFPQTAGTATSIINASQFVFAGVFGTLLMMYPASSLIPFAGLILGLGFISLLIIVVSKKK